MFKNSLIVVLKVDGKILREQGDKVYLPFGSEYSLEIKNNESVKAVASVSIDGEDVLDGKQLIIETNSKTELKGFMRGQTVKNSFRFIEKTKEISDYKGDRIDDGIVRVEYQFESKWNTICNLGFTSQRRWSDPWYVYYNYPMYGGTTGYKDSTKSCSNTAYDIAESSCYAAASNEDGITVKGSEINQEFNIGYTNNLDDTKYVITLYLRGKTATKQVAKPMLARDKLVCPTCGRTSRSDAKYCSNCSTYLL